MELTASELWSRILQSAKGRMPEQSYRTWLSGTQAVALSDRELVIEAPGQFHMEWLSDKYGALLTEIAHATVGRPLNLVFRPSADALPPVPQVSLSSLETAPPPPPRHSMDGAPAGAGLNTRYTFERFVVGNNNQLAAAACTAVSERPALAYNPLFLYGGVGLGKTHLMHAIGNAILVDDARRRVAYVSCEQFMNELVNAIQQSTTAAFRRRYRQIDLLLVDDVHFLEGKERTQEEFFHTFNALYDAQRQIVLTSDRPPKEIRGVEERLISRFEWGLVADMKAPDLETRIAILRKKAEDDNLRLDDEIIEYVARSCTASVRELEGAVIKLLAYSSLSNQEITVDLAETALTELFGARRRQTAPKVTAERIQDVVARRWGVSRQALPSKLRTKEVTVPRQVSMYLMKEILDLSLVKIGNLHGGRDHSTVIHSVRKISKLVVSDPDFARAVDAARAELDENAGP